MTRCGVNFFFRSLFLSLSLIYFYFTAVRLLCKKKIVVCQYSYFTEQNECNRHTKTQQQNDWMQKLLCFACIDRIDSNKLYYNGNNVEWHKQTDK